MTNQYVSPHILSIGECRFKLSSANKELVADTEAVFVKAAISQEPYILIDLDSPSPFVVSGHPELTDSSVDTIKRVILTAQSLHQQKYICIEACYLVTPNQKLVLIAGASFRGKSTLTAALTWQRGWRFISEDLVFFDMEHDRTISFVCPLSLRRQTPEMIAAATGIEPEPLLYGRWLVRPDLFCLEAVSSRPDILVCLEGIRETKPLTAEPLARSACLEKLIALGNWLTIPQAPDYLWETLAKTDCWTFTAGSLTERRDRLIELVER